MARPDLASSPGTPRPFPTSPASLARDGSWDLVHKADTCAKVLAEAHKLAAGGQLEAAVGPLTLRAVELLDDIDELLLLLHPIGNSREFALAAHLHRDLERIQAATTASRCKALATPKTPRKR